VVRQHFHRFWHKAKNLFSDLGFRKAEEVIVSGLQDEETVFRESILEEGRKTLGKLRHILKEVYSINIHVKSGIKGKGRLFELQGTLHLPNGDFHATAQGKDLYAALTRVLYEFEENARRLKSFHDDKRGR